MVVSFLGGCEKRCAFTGEINADVTEKYGGGFSNDGFPG